MKHSLQERHQESARWFEEAQGHAPGGVHSNFRLGMKPLPLFYERAQGSKLYDVDGNVYIDYALGMGPAILGHAPPAVIEAVASSLKDGQLYAGQHRAEVELAREITRWVPCAQQVRFSLTGSEAVQAALRVARAHTGRRKVVKFEGHYHGWCDSVYVSVHPKQQEAGPYPQPNKVPGSQGQDELAYQDLLILPWNDIDVFRGLVSASASEIAAVIMEPILCNTSVILPEPGYLEHVRELCTRHGIILIFDEVITGFRIGLSGAQGYLGVTPDLAVFAKALATGFPISCLAGRSEIMGLFGSGAVMHGGTFNTNVISCVAALATLEELAMDNGRAYDRLYRVGCSLIDAIREAAKRAGRTLLVQGLGTVFHTTFTDQTKLINYRDYLRCDLTQQARFVDLLMEDGVRITSRGTWFLSTAHTEQDIDSTVRAVAAALRRL